MTPRRFLERLVALVVAVVPAVSLAAHVSCKSPSNVSFQLELPESLAGGIVWMELGAFPGGVCPDRAQLSGGIPLVGPVARLVFKQSDPSPPGFGDLPKGTYGFAGVGRANDCAVIASGCNVVDLGSASAIDIQLSPTAGPAGACGPGSVCNDAVCVGAQDQDAAADGGQCSLAYVGGGPLADPLGLSSTLLSPPAIVAAPGGFLIAYREYDPDVGNARLTMLAIDDQGAASPPRQTLLPARCTNSPESDGTGLAWSGSAGTVALARAACPSSAPGVDLFQVDANGAIRNQGFSPSGGDTVRLGQAHPLAATPAGMLLAMVDATTKAASVSTVSGVALGPSTQRYAFGKLTDVVGAYVAGTGIGTGLLSLGTPPAKGDGGMMPGPDPGDSGLPLYTGSLLTLPASGSLSSLPTPDMLPASWVSLGSTDSRVLVAANGSATANPIVWYAFDVGAVSPTYVDSFAPQVQGDILYSDVALHADNAFFAIAVGSSVALVAFRKASTYLDFLVETDFAGDTRIPIAEIRDGLVAVAADASRVAVAWGTGRHVSASEALGGYAVFACTP